MAYTVIPTIINGDDITDDFPIATKAAIEELQARYLETGASGLVCQVTGTTSIPSASTTTFASMGTETLDPWAWHDAGSPTLVTPDVAGYYRCTVHASWANDTDVTRHQVAICKNGGLSYINDDIWQTGTNLTAAYSHAFPLVVMNGTSDNFSVRCFQTNTSANAVNCTVTLLVELVYRS